VKNQLNNREFCGTPDGMFFVAVLIGLPIVAGLALWFYFFPPAGWFEWGISIIHKPTGAILAYDPWGQVWHVVLLPLGLVMAGLSVWLYSQLLRNCRATK